MEHKTDIENFEIILKENRKNKTSSLYSNVKNSINHTTRPQDVIKIVSSQMQAIQKADRVINLDKHRKPNVLIQDKLAVHDKAFKNKPVNKFETQCVTDTQLIDMVTVAEAFGANEGVTQDLDASFTVSDFEKTNKGIISEERNTESINYNTGTTEANTSCNNIIDQRTDQVITKKADNNSHNTSAIETTFIGFTEDFTEHDNVCETKAKEDRENESIAVKVADNIAGKQTLIGITEDFVESDKDIFDENDYESIDDFDALERNRCISLSPILNKIEPIKTVSRDGHLPKKNKHRPLSPVLSIKNVKKSKSPSPLIFNLDSFERFEQVAIPLIEENPDLETAKHLINSQILDKELFLPSKTAQVTSLKEDLGTVTIISKNYFNNDGAKTSTTDSSELKLIDDKEKHSSTLEDEILFSSDEEEYEHKEMQDLPFTCALETSFYEHSDVLDKTMYVGFQTASNKSIQVYSESFTKAKCILNEVDSSCKKELTLTELVNICDSVSKKESEQIKEKTINPEKLYNKDNDIGTPDLSTSMLNELVHAVTKTSDHNKYSVSTDFKDAIREENNQFPDIDMSMINAVISNVSQEGNDKNTIQEVNFNVPESVKNIEPAKKNKFDGFMTANNKMIKLSDVALARCQKVFQDIDLDEKYDQNCQTNFGYKNIESNNNNSLTKPINDVIPRLISNNIDKDDILTDINDEVLLKEFENIEMSVKHEIKEEIPFIGFKTASCKNIKISDKAAERAKRLFEDIDNESVDKVYLNPKLTKSATETNNDGEKSKSNYRPENKNPMANVGFKTASNKSIKISEQAIANTKNLFHDISLDLVNDSKDIEAGKLSSENFTKPSTSTGFTGFQTANNKKVVISDEVLLKTKNIFKDIDIPINETTVNKTEIQCFNTDDKAETTPINKKTYEVNPLLNNTKVLPSVMSVSNAVRFQTANSKPIHISVEALEESKKIFHENSPEYWSQLYADKPENSKLVYNKVGFLTAGNKPVHISAKALEKSKKIFQDENPESTNKIGVCVPKTVKSVPKSTFQTANNKVHVPKKALDRTKKIFQNLGIQNVGRTANNKDVKVPEETLSKTKQLLNNLDNINDKSKPLDYSGLTTCIERTFKELQTASKKDLKAMEKYKDIFQDIDFSCDFDVKNTTPTVVKDTERESSKIEAMSAFKTANNMPVCISIDALARSKRLFDGIDDEHTNIENISNNAKRDRRTKEISPIMSNTSDYEALMKNNNCSNVNIREVGDFGGFKTASNKKVNISEQALTKSKQIFQNIVASDSVDESTDIDKIGQLGDDDHKNVAKRFKSNNLHDEIKENVADILNTQLLNNFEDTLYTEDFHQEIPSSNKRSGSPILSCPRAKRRRFETPHKANQIIVNTTAIKESLKPKESTNLTESYKINKLYKLKDLCLRDDNHSIDQYLTNFNFDTLMNFEFEGKRNDLSQNKIDIESLKVTFLNSVNKKLVPEGWLENHIKLILWKLVSYEIKFSKSLGTVCSAKNLINQLKYRYDKELYNAERPALRKILEKDDVPSKTLVLCVVAILVDGLKVVSVTAADNIELILTDGWYCIIASIDKMLTRLVNEKKIVVGSKIATHGAELLNCQQGVAPWEDTSSIRLKIFGNSTRRARWDARLGYHGNGAILSQLSNVKLDGGKVSKLRLYIARVYPALYVEKFDDGSTVTRSERLEHLHQAKYEAERQNILEKLYEEVEKEFPDLDSQDSGGTWENNKKTCLQSGSQIFEAIRRSKDPSDIRNNLTSSQMKLLEAHTAKYREQLLDKVQAKLTEKIDSNGLTRGRNVVSVLKVRVVGIGEGDSVATKGLLSIWKPNDSILDLVKEDTWIEVMNVVPTAYRYSEIQISAGRQSIFLQSKYKENDKTKQLINTLRRTCYDIKELNQNTNFNEADTVGIIFLIEPSLKDFDSKSQFQNVYLTDKDCNMICVNFWGGLQKFGFHNVLDTGQVVACINLQKRSGNTRNIPHYRATEFTYFTKTPKNQQANNIMDGLNKISVLDRRRICEECVVLKNNFSVKSNENITPYRMNFDTKKAFLDSVEKIAHSEINLTGLDFESSFRQKDELSPKTLKRKQEVNNRINKLKMYGEPPPLTPIHIINKSKNALSSYKSPMNSDVCTSVATNNKIDIGRNVENKTTPLISIQDSTSVTGTNKNTNLDNKDSPVTSLNKTYVKSSINPVKLNFDDNSDFVDQFAEEFEASPPLSLD